MGLNMAGQVAQHNAENQAVDAANRDKLRNYREREKQHYEDSIFANAEYKNDISKAEGEQDETYQAMMDQWSQEDFTLKKLFSEGDQKIEKAIIEMYENDYAGTQTGRTAARLAGKSAMEAGRKKSETLHNMMMAKEETEMRKADIHRRGKSDTWKSFESIMFAPIHGDPPLQPTMEAKKGSAGLILGLAGAGLQGYKDFKANRAVKISSGDD